MSQQPLQDQSKTNASRNMNFGAEQVSSQLPSQPGYNEEAQQSLMAPIDSPESEVFTVKMANSRQPSRERQPLVPALKQLHVSDMVRDYN